MATEFLSPLGQIINETGDFEAMTPLGTILNETVAAAPPAGGGVPKTTKLTLLGVG